MEVEDETSLRMTDIRKYHHQIKTPLQSEVKTQKWFDVPDIPRYQIKTPMRWEVKTQKTFNVPDIPPYQIKTPVRWEVKTRKTLAVPDEVEYPDKGSLESRLSIGSNQICNICLQRDLSTFKAGSVLTEQERTIYSNCRIHDWIQICNVCIQRQKWDTMRCYDRSRSGPVFGPGEALTEVNFFF